MKKLLLSCLLLCLNLLANAQATDLVVDCQTPGELSTLISDGDKQTVRNLKVTGEIRIKDLKFIGSLIENYNLDGVLDLSECTIDNLVSLWNSEKDKKDSIRVYRIPRSATGVESCAENLYVDTLYYDCKAKTVSCQNIWFNWSNHVGKVDVGHLYIGEGVDSIGDFCRVPGMESAGSSNSVKSVHLPSSIKSINGDAFWRSGLTKCNFNDLINLETIGNKRWPSSITFECNLDTVIVPHKLTSYPINTILYERGTHIFIGENTKSFTGGPSYKTVGSGLIFHISQVTPPGYSTWFSKETIYVPKGAKSAYVNAGWDATIIEMNPVEKVVVSEHEIVIDKGQQHSLSVTITPEDADDIRIKWSSQDESIAFVNDEGTITAINSGQAKIYATSIATGIKDSCLVTVRKNVESVVFNEPQIVLNTIGDSHQLSITITPADATEKSVTWKSSNEQVCIVSASGLVTATGVGSAVVTVTTVDGGHSATCVVKVLQHVTGLMMEKHSTSLKVGENEQLKVVVNPDNADDKSVDWSSSNEQLATVDANGKVTAIKAGEVWVKAVSKDNEEAKDSCKVTVIQPVSSVNLSKTNVELNNIGESIQLEAVVLPEDASDKSVTWKSSNEQVCSVSNNGLVSATGAGNAIVTVTTTDGGHTANCLVKVIQHVTGLTMEKHSTSLKVGENEQLKAVVSPDNADDKSVEWSSSNEQLATVDANGNVTAIKAGEVWVKVVSKDNEEAKDSCKVTVIQPVTGITLVQTNVELNAISENIQLEVVIMPEDASDKSVTWKSSNEQVCVVSPSGLLTATGAGSAVVTVTTVDGGFSATCVVKVIQHVNSLSLDRTAMELKVAETDRLVATVLPDNSDDKTVLWDSSNEQIATVDANGNVTAITTGEVWVKAVSKDNAEAKDSCKVTVIQPVTGITLSESNITFNNVGETKQLVATVEPENASNKDVIWSSSNENVCIVNNGMVTAVSAGTTTVTATTVDGNFAATCIVKVVQHVTKVELNNYTLSLKVGETGRLTATISPDNAENKSVNWFSSDEQVATVDANGNVTAIKAGETWINVVSKDNAEAKDSCKITVIQPVTGIVLSQESYHLTNIGETIQLEATVLPDDATNKEVKWTSSNENICMVSNGKVVAMGYGNAVIIATTIDGGFMASCAIIVEKESIPVTSITLSQTSVTLAKGESLQLTATVLPSDATNKTLIWKSSDENVCVTTQTGMIIAVNEGTAVITVVPESGVGQAQCNVIVNSEVNAIREINKAEKTPEQIYDMMGRKVDRVVKGRMYIRNGQKFIAK